MSRQTWRNIFIGIIGLTIPCYLLAVFVYFTQGGGVQPTPTFTSVPSRTPINLTELALTDPSLIVTNPAPTFTPSVTPLSGLDLTPIVPTSGGGFEPAPFVTPTTIPTRFVTRTPTLPPPATNTQVFVPPPNTPVPQPTQPILLPPTDTPSP